LGEGWKYTTCALITGGSKQNDQYANSGRQLDAVSSLSLVQGNMFVKEFVLYQHTFHDVMMPQPAIGELYVVSR